MGKATEKQRLSLLQRVSWAAGLRCPNCGVRWLFVHWLKPRPACANCGQALVRIDEGGGNYLGSLVLNFAAAELAIALLVLVTVILTWPSPPWNGIIYGGVALALLAPLICYPFAKLLWLAIDLSANPDS